MTDKERKDAYAWIGLGCIVGMLSHDWVMTLWTIGLLVAIEQMQKSKRNA